jgi:hypothetical protein
VKHQRSCFTYSGSPLVDADREFTDDSDLRESEVSFSLFFLLSL